MNDSPLEARVRAVIAKTFRLPEADARGALQMSDPPAWDSLGHMDLVAALEKEFAVRFPGYTLGEITSLPAIVQALEKQGVR